MTTNNNQPEDKTPTFKVGQEVWVKAVVRGRSTIDPRLYSLYTGDYTTPRCFAPSEIRTTEQIMQEHGALAPQHKAIKYEYTMTLNGDFAIYQVIKYTATETEAMKELNRLNREASHFAKETPQNAELTAQNAEPSEGDECWVRAKYIEKNDFGNLIELNDGSLNKRTHIQDSDLHFTKPQTQEIIFTEPNRTRKFRKGDKVQIVERDGRTPWLTDGFILNGYYTVCENEDINGDVCLHDETRCEFFTISWFFLDLVEPAPEPKYWLHESPKTYSIYYKGQFGRVITAMLMQKDLYTLEEAQEQCDKLNQKREEENA